MTLPAIGPCSLCDEQGVALINGAWFCVPHCDDGFRAAFRGQAVEIGADPDAVEEAGGRMLEDLARRREGDTPA